jgi:hypothetical protein
MPPAAGPSLSLGGKQRTLRYTARSLNAAEAEMEGTPWLQILLDSGRGSMRALTVMLWAALLHESPEITLEEAADFIEPPIAPFAMAVAEAISPWTSSPKKGARAARRSTT